MSSPVANPDVLEMLANTPFVVSADDLLSNDTDADGDSLSIISCDNADHVSVTRLSDGSFSIMPQANYSGPASFTYTISDGQATASATVTVSAQKRIRTTRNTSRLSGTRFTAVRFGDRL